MSHSTPPALMQQQMQRLARKVEREKLLLSAPPELSIHILDHARAHGRVTVREMVTVTGVSRNTLKEHFKSLLQNRQLELHGKGRGAWYSLK
jgi:predicted HTH transcriptional regulator